MIIKSLKIHRVIYCVFTNIAKSSGKRREYDFNYRLHDSEAKIFHDRRHWKVSSLHEEEDEERGKIFKFPYHNILLVTRKCSAFCCQSHSPRALSLLVRCIINIRHHHHDPIWMEIENTLKKEFVFFVPRVKFLHFIFIIILIEANSSSFRRCRCLQREKNQSRLDFDFHFHLLWYLLLLLWVLHRNKPTSSETEVSRWASQ